MEHHSCLSLYSWHPAGFNSPPPPPFVFVVNLQSSAHIYIVSPYLFAHFPGGNFPSSITKNQQHHRHVFIIQTPDSPPTTHPPPSPSPLPPVFHPQRHYQSRPSFPSRRTQKDQTPPDPKVPRLALSRCRVDCLGLILRCFCCCCCSLSERRRGSWNGYGWVGFSTAVVVVA